MVGGWGAAGRQRRARGEQGEVQSGAEGLPTEHGTELVWGEARALQGGHRSGGGRGVGKQAGRTASQLRFAAPAMVVLGF